MEKTGAHSSKCVRACLFDAGFPAQSTKAPLEQAVCSSFILSPPPQGLNTLHSTQKTPPPFPNLLETISQPRYGRWALQAGPLLRDPREF